MNTKYLLLLLAAGCVVNAVPLRAIGPMETTPSGPATSPSNSPIPSVTYPVTRYEALWTKSPFAVATSEETVQASPDYMLVGIANVDGVFYASVVERDNGEHFLISSDKPTRGMTLKSISRGGDGQDTYASVIKDGQPLTLKLEQAPAAAGGVAANAAPGIPAPNPVGPGIVPQQLQMPGANPFPGGGSARPFPRLRRPKIILPPQQQQTPVAPPPAAPQGGAAPTTQMAPPPPH